MPQPPRRRWLPPRDLLNVVLVLACICAVTLVTSVGALVYGVIIYLPKRDHEIQQQRLDGTRAQCKIVYQLGVEIMPCAQRVCEIATDLGQSCSVQMEAARARREG